MPLGAPIVVSVQNERVPTVRLVDSSSNWIYVMDYGGQNTEDAGKITNPLVEITDPAKHMIILEGLATSIMFRSVYPSTMSIVSAAAIKMFGRTGNDPWTIVRTPVNNVTFSTPGAATDTSDGLRLYTNPSTFLNITGYTQLLCGVQRTVTMGGIGADNNACLLQAMII